MPNIKDLNKLRKEISKTRIALCEPSRNGNYIKLLGKTPAYTMMIPNSLLISWKRYRTLEETLDRPPTDFVDMANWCLDGLRLKKGVSTIETRLSTENGRFHSQYSKLGGSKRQSVALKVTKMLVLVNEMDTVLSASPTQLVEGMQVSYSACPGQLWGSDI